MKEDRQCFVEACGGREYLPHVAYVLLWYPVFTQPFIFREVEGLKAQGLPLTVYSLYASHLRQCSPEMLAVADETRTHGIRMTLPFLGEFFRQMLCRPLFMCRLLRRWMFRRWPNWEVFGENVWGFVAGVYLARLMREDGIDSIHSPWPRGATMAALVASQLSGIPFSTSARGDNLAPADPDLVDKLCTAFFVRANNKADIARMRAMLPPACSGDHIHLVYNSLTIPVRGQCAARLQKPVRLLAVGRFDVTKGFEYLLQACKKLRDEGFDFRLTLIGGGGHSLGLGHVGPKLMAMRKEWGLEEVVDMPGLVSHEELGHIFMSHDIFMAPCIVHESGRRDGIPNTVIEALAYGMPVISTRVNGIPEVVRHEDTGLLVDPCDSAALAAAVRRMADNPEEARRMGERGRTLTAAMFNPEANTRALGLLFVSQFARWKEEKACVA